MLQSADRQRRLARWLNLSRRAVSQSVYCPRSWKHSSLCVHLPWWCSSPRRVWTFATSSGEASSCSASNRSQSSWLIALSWWLSAPVFAWWSWCLGKRKRKMVKGNSNVFVSPISNLFRSATRRHFHFAPFCTFCRKTYPFSSLMSLLNVANVSI